MSSLGKEWRGLAFLAAAALERLPAPWGGRGRYGTLPVRKGSAARSRREGKAFPPDSLMNIRERNLTKEKFLEDYAST